MRLYVKHVTLSIIEFSILFKKSAIVRLNTTTILPKCQILSARYAKIPAYNVTGLLLTIVLHVTKVFFVLLIVIMNAGVKVAIWRRINYAFLVNSLVKNVLAK